MDKNIHRGGDIEQLRKRWKALQRAAEEGTTDINETVGLVSMALDALEALQEQLHLQTDELDEAREALEEECARYLDLFESCPDGYIVTNATGKIQAMSGVALELFETELHDIVDKNVTDLILETDRALFQEHLLQTIAGELPENTDLDHKLQTKDGHVLMVSLRTSLLRDTNGNVSGMRWLIRDVTEIRAIQEALRKSEAQFRALFENAPIGIALVDLDMRIMHSNAELQNFLGVDVGALQGQSMLSVLHERERIEVEQQVHTLINGGQGRYSLDARYRHSSGQWLWGTTVMSLAEARTDNHDSLDGEFVIVMVADITEQTEISAELAEVQRKLLESYETERLYLAQELHDLPMQELYATELMVGQLRTVVSGEGPQAAIDKIREQIQKINRMLRDVCSELRPPTLASFGLRAAIEAHVTTFRERHTRPAVHLNLMTNDIKLPQWMGLALYRICQQAINNVVQHADADNLYIDLTVNSDAIELAIRDDGRGFVVPDRWVTLTRANHLGLAGSAERASAVGANFEVQSSPGEGTVIRVTVFHPSHNNETHPPAAV